MESRSASAISHSLYIRVEISRQSVRVCNTKVYCVVWLWLSFDRPRENELLNELCLL